MKPELIAARVERPIASTRLFEIHPGDPGRPFDQGAERGREAGADRAAEVLALGGDRVDVDAGAEVDRDAGLAEAVVGGDRVDEAVGADLERIFDPDRHPGLQAGADGQALRVQVAPRQLLELAAQRRHHRGDADGVDLAERHPTEGEEAGDSLGQLVAGRPRPGLEAPVLGELLALEGAEMGLGVADVDREKHGSRLFPTGRG